MQVFSDDVFTIEVGLYRRIQYIIFGLFCEVCSFHPEVRAARKYSYCITASFNALDVSFLDHANYHAVNLAARSSIICDEKCCAGQFLLLHICCPGSDGWI